MARRISHAAVLLWLVLSGTLSPRPSLCVRHVRTPEFSEHHESSAFIQNDTFTRVEQQDKEEETAPRGPAVRVSHSDADADGEEATVEVSFDDGEEATVIASYPEGDRALIGPGPSDDLEVREDINLEDDEADWAFESLRANWGDIVKRFQPEAAKCQVNLTSFMSCSDWAVVEDFEKNLRQDARLPDNFVLFGDLIKTAIEPIEPKPNMIALIELKSTGDAGPSTERFPEIITCETVRTYTKQALHKIPGDKGQKEKLAGSKDVLGSFRNWLEDEVSSFRQHIEREISQVFDGLLKAVVEASRCCSPTFSCLLCLPVGQGDSEDGASCLGGVKQKIAEATISFVRHQMQQQVFNSVKAMVGGIVMDQALSLFFLLLDIAWGLAYLLIR